MRSYEEFETVLDNVFKRDDVRGKWGTELDGEVAWHLGHAFVGILTSESDAQALQIVVGRDMRQGSPEMAAQLIRGIRAAGGTVDDVGMCGSEMIYFVTGEMAAEYTGGAMVTASHNPPEYAGVKFVKSGAEPLSSEELKALKTETARSYELHLQRALRGPERGAKTTGFVEKLLGVTGISRRKETTNLTVVVEAGNGMGGVTFRPVADRLEELLPGICFVFSNETPDGTFPVCTPNPLLEDYLSLLSQRVRKEKADLGICFDGDADRAGFVDDKGELVDAAPVSMVLYKMLAPLCSEGGDLRVMGNLNSSIRLARFITENIKPSNEKEDGFIMTPVGHAKIKGLMRAWPQLSPKSTVLFASEHSGHYFYPNFFYADSGMTTALFMIRFALEARAEGMALSEKLLSLGNKCHASGEINTRLKDDDEAVEKIKSVAGTYVDDRKLSWRGVKEGRIAGTHEVVEFPPSEAYDPDKLAALDLRVDSEQDEKPQWWFSVRKSGNEPELRLNVESTDEDRMKEIRDQLLGIIRAKSGDG